MNSKFYIILNEENNTHIEYKEGLNTISEPFEPNSESAFSGFTFTVLKNIVNVCVRIHLHIF